MMPETMPALFSLPPSGSLLLWLLTWLVTASLVSASMAAAAFVLERLLRGLVPARALWAGAITLALVLAITQPLRTTAVSAPSVSGVAVPLRLEPSLVTPSPLVRSYNTLRDIVTAVPATFSNTGSAIAQRLRRELESSAPATQRVATSGLLLAWPLASAVLGLLLFASYRRQRRLLSHAPTARIGAQTVRLSDHFGPAVVGLRTPDIVVPSWLLSRSPREQQLVVAHEQSHVHAGDHVLLLAANMAVVLMPWNAALWFMTSRLRLAIELDCDARVLSRVAAPREYGQLLIELSAALQPARRLHAVPAFSYRASHLERRLHTMTARPARFRQARRITGVLMATATLAVACKAELPTASDVAAMDVASAQRQAVAFTGQSDDARFFVNGVETSKADAMKISSDRIATIEVRKGAKGEQLMLVATTDASKTASFSAIESARAEAAPSNVIRLRRADSGTVLLRASTDSSPTRIRLSSKAGTGPAPLYILDGKRVDESTLNRIAPSTIESVEVLKGASGAALYGNDAANGVVVIKTKR
jgi:TonB-dependent SusC/RagA subfamily outer membrane receptor